MFWNGRKARTFQLFSVTILRETKHDNQTWGIDSTLRSPCLLDWNYTPEVKPKMFVKTRTRGGEGEGEENSEKKNSFCSHDCDVCVWERWNVLQISNTTVAFHSFLLPFVSVPYLPFFFLLILALFCFLFFSPFFFVSNQFLDRCSSQIPTQFSLVCVCVKMREQPKNNRWPSVQIQNNYRIERR